MCRKKVGASVPSAGLLGRGWLVSVARRLASGGADAVRAPIISVFVQKIGWENTKTTDYFRGMGKNRNWKFFIFRFKRKKCKKSGKREGKKPIKTQIMVKIGGLSGENEKKPGQVHVQEKKPCATA